MHPLPSPRCRMRLRPSLLLCLALALGLANVGELYAAATHAAQAAPWRLSEQCPPGHERLPGGVCRLATLYDQYASLQGRGVGGTRTALPPRRDGFTAAQIDLGRYLFFDPLLSGQQRLSCASCHHPALGFSDGLRRSRGSVLLLRTLHHQPLLAKQSMVTPSSSRTSVASGP